MLAGYYPAYPHGDEANLELGFISYVRHYILRDTTSPARVGVLAIVVVLWLDILAPFRYGDSNGCARCVIRYVEKRNL